MKRMDRKSDKPIYTIFKVPKENMFCMDNFVFGLDYQKDYEQQDDEVKGSLDNDYAILRNTVAKILNRIVSNPGFSPETLLKLGEQLKDFSLSISNSLGLFL